MIKILYTREFFNFMLTYLHIYKNLRKDFEYSLVNGLIYKFRLYSNFIVKYSLVTK